MEMPATKTSQTTNTLMKKIYQRRNEEKIGHFSVGIMLIFCLYSIIYWTGNLHKRFGPTNNTALQFPIQIMRKIRKLLILKVPGFDSAGHAVIFTLYVIVSLSVLFSNIDLLHPTNFAKRLGWLTVLNIWITIFLSLKNTPLALLTNQSYEKLNSLHQAAGYSCIICLLLHTLVYTISLSNQGKLSSLAKDVQLMGIAAGLSLMIIFSATFLRKRFYELFYVTHITMSMLVLILSGLHRPRLFITKSSYILITAGTIWALDRFLRLAKYFAYSFKNTATLTPLPHGGTRVVLNKFPKSVYPGQHFFIWLPGIRILETHPFTCISTDPGEFIISAHNGFTRSLHKRALKEPGVTLRASLDGPYGTVPDLTLYSRVVFIAGGSGASYTCSLAIDLVRKLGHSTKTSIDFTLALRHKEIIEWTSPYLSILANATNVNLQVYVTQRSSADSSFGYTTPFFFDDYSFADSYPHISDPEKTSQNLSKFKRPSDTNTIDETNGFSVTNSRNKTTLVLNLGRPDLDSLISQAVNTASIKERIAVVVCGPRVMTSSVRRVVARNIRPEGPSLQLFCEQFNW